MRIGGFAGADGTGPGRQQPHRAAGGAFGLTAILVSTALLTGCDRMAEAGRLFADAMAPAEAAKTPETPTGAAAPGAGSPAPAPNSGPADAGAPNPEIAAPNPQETGDQPAPAPNPDPAKAGAAAPVAPLPASEAGPPPAPDAAKSGPTPITPAHAGEAKPPEVPAAPPPPLSQTAPAAPPAAAAATPVFDYYGAGALQPNTGTGASTTQNFAPDMRFPIATHPAYLGSQVYRAGGGLGPKDKPDQCDASNFAYPWRDNFCETRARDSDNPFCPKKGVHLGDDIRAGDPGLCHKMLKTARADRDEIPVVAVEDGSISNIGSYTITLRAEQNTYRYLHLNMKKLQVKTGQDVKAGDIIGYVSNDFGVDKDGKPVPTTLHLHFEIRANTENHGWATVPPYSALVAAYARREGGPGRLISEEATAVKKSAPAAAN